MSRYFSLDFWPPYVTRKGGDVWLLGVNIDWIFRRFTVPDHVSVTVRLLGYGVCLAYYPRGKA